MRNYRCELFPNQESEALNRVLEMITKRGDRKSQKNGAGRIH